MAHRQWLMVAPPTRASAMSHVGEHSEDALVIGLVARVLQHFPVPDDAVLIEDENRALGNPLQPDHVLVEDAVVANRLLVEIAEQLELEVLLIVKRLQR